VLCEDFEAYLDLLLKTSWPMLSFYLFDRNANLFMANILFINNLIVYGAAVYICCTVNSLQQCTYVVLLTACNLST
jgi:hypothetical protein